MQRVCQLERCWPHKRRCPSPQLVNTAWCWLGPALRWMHARRTGATRSMDGLTIAATRAVQRGACRDNGSSPPALQGPGRNAVKMRELRPAPNGSRLTPHRVPADNPAMTVTDVPHPPDRRLDGTAARPMPRSRSGAGRRAAPARSRLCAPGRVDARRWRRADLIGLDEARADPHCRGQVLARRFPHRSEMAEYRDSAISCISQSREDFRATSCPRIPADRRRPLRRRHDPPSARARLVTARRKAVVARVARLGCLRLQALADPARPRPPPR